MHKSYTLLKVLLEYAPNRLSQNAPVPTDRLRFCIKSTHATGVDILVNLDERDAVHSASVILAGLSALGSVTLTPASAAR
jgi:hypothetical protein